MRLELPGPFLYQVHRKSTLLLLDFCFLIITGLCGRTELVHGLENAFSVLKGAETPAYTRQARERKHVWVDPRSEEARLSTRRLRMGGPERNVNDTDQVTVNDTLCLEGWLLQAADVDSRNEQSPHSLMHKAAETFR
ncbi:hypothetical protein TWF506_009404 [Arthrobotrys conoides]|uniref:Uncharacterized protein n=1 Tax=Arthrobotrys conoides TaxID=74498 RepID=A0AAN8NKS7_9PEZI